MDTNQVKNQTRWYRAVTWDGETELQPLELGGIENSHDSISEDDVIWVQCYDVDRVYLDGARVHRDK
ncbi:hypothetical protein DFQ28_000173 [Apophysomyces sp. BC1034]|nr:hypothetical protein DFQ30_000368 [Apophysomyces sp. BC1015]KAG0168266.1 hypothetical protein DFQ29_010221 [Apophysomyces sp. BC1021]KAG0184085.1 hypothetical protein DFQ28_000173 [Apophysomyces sp. BC1034]